MVAFGSRVSVILLLTLALTASAADWNHADQITGWDGPCQGGKSQSPINFNTSKMKKATFEDFKFVGYDRNTKNDTLVNDGHSVKMESTYQPQVHGGGLPGIYQFAQFHLHWGSIDSQGSEHIVNEKAYPMELHLVHFKTEYGNDIGAAIGAGAKQRADDSLAVLGIFFEIQKDDNKALEPMMNALDEIATKDLNTKVKMQSASLATLLPSDTKNFYRYMGSLTTPGCNQIVVWTVFKEPIGISASQMAKFRQNVKIDESGKKLVDNYRKVQPLNGRVVKSVSTVESSAIHHVIAWPMVMIALIHMLTL